jgi:hypothetical protein
MTLQWRHQAHCQNSVWIPLMLKIDDHHKPAAHRVDKRDIEVDESKGDNEMMMMVVVVVVVVVMLMGMDVPQKMEGVCDSDAMDVQGTRMMKVDNRWAGMDIYDVVVVCKCRWELFGSSLLVRRGVVG